MAVILQKSVDDDEAAEGDEDHRWTKRTQNVLNNISSRIQAAEAGEVGEYFFFVTESLGVPSIYYFLYSCFREKRLIFFKFLSFNTLLLQKISGEEKHSQGSLETDRQVE